uniref:Uncharacterized protein n=1 Tax=Aegilops tauschii subsp. strangulata TaxID=200361 RepID=A0A453RZU0_AEGTS
LITAFWSSIPYYLKSINRLGLKQCRQMKENATPSVNFYKTF